ncbi:MAG TPA: hypothetical protein VFL28_14125, partial [bacterium]|nr:hypothetical protein [bacterium]
ASSGDEDRLPVTKDVTREVPLRQHQELVSQFDFKIHHLVDLHQPVTMPLCNTIVTGKLQHEGKLTVTRHSVVVSSMLEATASYLGETGPLGCTSTGMCTLRIAQTTPHEKRQEEEQCVGSLQ